MLANARLSSGLTPVIIIDSPAAHWSLARVIIKVKQLRASSVLGWGTTYECREVFYPSLEYSSVPNRHVGQNKHAGGKILKKTLNVQDIISVQEENFLENQ